VTAKSLIALVAITLLGGAIAGCGNASKSASSAAQTSPDDTTTAGTAGGTAGRATASSKNSFDPDHDDYITENFGHAASEADKRTITAIVRSYYVAAVAGDGGKGCPMILPSLARAIPHDYGRSPSLPSLHGSTCATVMAKLFELYHRRLAADLASMVVKRVRVKGNTAFVLLAFSTTPEPRVITMKREGGVWRFTELLDIPLP
jgi:hypothetical protein